MIVVWLSLIKILLLLKRVNQKIGESFVCPPRGGEGAGHCARNGKEFLGGRGSEATRAAADDPDLVDTAATGEDEAGPEGTAKAATDAHEVLDSEMGHGTMLSGVTNGCEQRYR